MSDLTDAYYRQLAANAKLGVYTPPIDPLLTEPVEVNTSAGFIDILKGIANVFLPGTPFPTAPNTIPTNIPNVPIQNTIATWLAPPTGGQNLPAVITRSGPVVARGIAYWANYAWKLLITGQAVETVVSFLQNQIPTDQETAVTIVERAVRTRGGRRRMNPLNPHALRRAITRINRFDKFANHTEKVLRRYARRK